VGVGDTSAAVRVGGPGADGGVHGALSALTADPSAAEKEACGTEEECKQQVAGVGGDNSLSPAGPGGVAGSEVLVKALRNCWIRYGDDTTKQESIFLHYPAD
jgi:hypothetical protein